MKRCEVEEETAGQEEKLVIEEERTETVEQPPDSTYDFIDMSLYASVIMLFRSTDACFFVFTRCHVITRTVQALTLLVGHL